MKHSVCSWEMECVGMYVLVCKLSHVQLFVTPGTVGPQTSLSMEFSGKGHWSGCHCLLPRVFATQGPNLLSLCPQYWQADSSPLQNLRSPRNVIFPAKFRKEKKKKTCYLASLQTAVTPLDKPWDNSGCENTTYWPQVGELHIKGMILVSLDSCIFPDTEKSYIP